MPEIKKVFRENIPALRFMGREYDTAEMWREWWMNDWVVVVEEAMNGTDEICRRWENGGGHVALTKTVDGERAGFYLGMFTPIDTPPIEEENFIYIDFDGVDLGTCWLYGERPDVHDTSACRQAVESAGMTVWKDEEGAEWSFENLMWPRYTDKDENGKVILDYCIFVEREK